jgi:hypothetical protein
MLVASAVSLIAAGSVTAEPLTRPSTAVVVDIPIPPGVSRTTLDQGIFASIPNYKNLPGLI